jgi:hypothetical protein
MFKGWILLNSNKQSEQPPLIIEHEKWLRHISLGIHVVAWDRHNNGVGLNRLMGSQPSHIDNWPVPFIWQCHAVPRPVYFTWQCVYAVPQPMFILNLLEILVMIFCPHTLVVVPHSTLPGVIHWLWYRMTYIARLHWSCYRMTHRQVKGTGCGTV